MLYLRQNYQVFCPACGAAVETNEHGEHHCPDCDLWYTDQQLFGYQPRHLTPLAVDDAETLAKIETIKKEIASVGRVPRKFWHRH